MFEVKSINNAGHVVVHAERETIAEAIAAVRGKIYDVQEDLPEHPNHFDVVTWQGDYFMIEPKRDGKR